MIRHILFNGFHPVIPWSAFLIFGMWLGRQELSLARVRKKLFIWGVSVWVVTELIFTVIKIVIGNGKSLGLIPAEVDFLFSTSIIPPLPQYVIAASSLAAAIIMCCLHISEYFYKSRLVIWLQQTGQLSLTLYVAHVIIGMGTLEAIGRLENQTIGFALLSSVIFCISGIVFSVWWLKIFKMGPLERLFRKIAN